MRDHDSIILDDFKGMFCREPVNFTTELYLSDNIPEGHLEYCHNMVFTYRGMRTREGFRYPFISPANLNTQVTQMHVYKPTSGAPRILWLEYAAGTGKIWDSGNLGGYPGAGWILSLAGMSDFSIVNMFGRCYITPHDGVKGLSGQSVYVYSGTVGTTARVTGGSAPAAGFAVASGAAGHIEAGDHLYGIIYETDTGFLTQACPLLRLTADGTKKVNVTLMPAGGASVTKIHVVATKSIIAYNGNPKDYELFLVPSAMGGVVNNGVANTTLDFFDSDLVDSADYLYDQFTNVPAGSVIIDYNGRLMIGGVNGSEAYVYGSKSGNPESVNQTDGFIAVSPADGAYGVKNLAVFRGNLYIFKDMRTFVSSDNSFEPSTWSVEILDASVGCGPHGVAQVLDSLGVTEECLILASPKGLIKYDGSFADRPLSWKVEAIWNSWDFTTNWKFTKVFIDPITKRIYVLAYCPSTQQSDTYYVKNWGVAGGDPSSRFMMLVGDYTEGLDWEHIKWAWHVYPQIVLSGTMYNDLDTSTGKVAPPRMLLCWYNGSGNPYFVLQSWTLPTGTIDNSSDQLSASTGRTVSQLIQFPYVPDNQEGELNHYAGLDIRASAVGRTSTGDAATLALTLQPEGAANTPVTANLVVGPGAPQNYKKLMNLISEKAKLKIALDSVSWNITPLNINQMYIYRIALFYKPVWTGRPL